MSEQEMIVQVNAEGEIVGPIERKKAHAENILHAVALMFLFHPENGTLVMQVRANNDKIKYPRHLGVPAGHIKYQEGKTIEELAKESAYTELREELGAEFAEGIQLTQVLKQSHQGSTEQQTMFIFTGETDRMPASSAIQADEVEEVLRVDPGTIVEQHHLMEITEFTLAALQLVQAVREKQAIE